MFNFFFFFFVGKEFNGCGVCANRNDTNWNDYGKDCRGVCSGSIANTYYVDDCGNCLLPSDDSWNDCLPETTNATLRKKESELTTVIVIVCIIAFLIIVAACIIIGALWKKQTAINARFDSLAATYVHMDENPQHGAFPAEMPMSSSTTSTKTNRKGMQTVPDAEESGEDE